MIASGVFCSTVAGRKLPAWPGAKIAQMETLYYYYPTYLTGSFGQGLLKHINRIFNGTNG